jgi:hypothetical protein
MAAFPSGIPGMVGGAMPGASPQVGPPPTVPGITQPQIPPPAALMQAIQKKPQSSQALIKQAILMLESAADMDNRMEPRISAAVKLLKGPAKPTSD